MALKRREGETQETFDYRQLAVRQQQAQLHSKWHEHFAKLGIDQGHAFRRSGRDRDLCPKK